MKHLSGPLLGLTWLACAGSAFAAAPFEQFVQICVSNHSDAAKALVAADQAGWKPITLSVLEALAKANIKNTQGRMLTKEHHQLLLLVAKSQVPFAPGVTVPICSVTSYPGDADFERQAAALAAVPMDAELSKKNPTYAWREDTGVHVAIKHGPSEETALVAEGAHVLSVDKDEKSSMVTLVAGTATRN